MYAAAEKDIADPFTRPERQHRPVVCSLRLVRLGHKTGVEGRKVIAAGHYVLEKETSFAVGRCRVQLWLPPTVLWQQS
jgi:hypothetical protein